MLLTKKGLSQSALHLGKEHKQNTNKSKMKEVNNPQKMRPCRRRRWRRWQRLSESLFNLYFNINLLTVYMMQDFSCRCVAAWVHACMCVWSQEHICMCKQMFCVCPMWHRSRPSIFPSSPSPLLSFHKHLFFGTMWVTPASQWRRCRIRSPYKVVAITAEVVRELAPLSALNTHLGGRKWGEESKRCMGDWCLD